MIRSIVPVLFALLAFPPQSKAAIIHDNLGVGGTFGSLSGSYAFGYALFSPPARFIGVPFTPSQTAKLGTLLVPLSVTSFSAGPPPEAIRIRVVADAGGLPGSTVIDEFVISDFVFVSPGAPAFTLYSVDAASHGTVLAGVQYWLFPEVLTTGAVDHHPFGYWASNNTNEIGLARDSPGGGPLLFDNGNSDGAFRLTGDIVPVPEPGTPALAALAAMLLTARRLKLRPAATAKNRNR